jgi:hypothetical protein
MTSKKLALLGIVILLVQISAVPSSWKSAFMILTGIFLIMLSMKGYFKALNNKTEEGSISSFIDKQDNPDRANDVDTEKIS